MNSIAILFLFLMLPDFSAGQTQLTGNLKEDSRILMAQYNAGLNVSNFKVEGEKSPILAGLFSLVLPGAGEFYTEEYLKAAIFAGVEIALITTAVIYDNKGDKQTDEFESYADEKWSVVRYAEWLQEYYQAEITIDYETPGLQPWERVDWAELNAAEHGSHKLPPHGEQQYYELIGKYYQYSSGWDDYTSGPNNVEMSPNFHYYSGLRGDANDYYNVASKTVILLYINHFLSALDGIWSAVQFNKDLAVNVRVQENYLTKEIDLIPYLNLKYSF
jgi:hypothetical protein